jgi:uncharacterized membrane protein YfcA
MIPTDPSFYLIGLTTIFIVSVGKGAFGGGLAILGVPLLSLVVSPLDAAIIVAPLVTWSKPDLVWLAPAMLVGIGLGYIFFVSVDPRMVAAGIGAITLIFAADWFLRGRKAPHKERPVSPPLALLAGAASGFTTFIAHAGGPPMSAYLLHRGLNKTIYAGTAVALFSLGNLVKLAPYSILAFAKPETLVQAAVLAPVVPVGVLFGKYIHDRLDQGRLFFWCYMILIVTAAKLLYDALRAFSL